MRFRLVPTSAQEGALLEHCAHARCAPGYSEQSRQLTEARKEFGWLAAGSQTVQQLGWVRFRWSRVAVSAALSSGELLSVPGLPVREAERLRRLRRKPARARRGSHRRTRLKAALSRLSVRQTDRRKDWVEKVSTDLARRFDLIRVEDLKITNMVRSARGTMATPGRNARAKAGLNRSIHAAGWGRLVRRLEDKAAGRVERIGPAFTSQTCNACGHVLTSV